ncbi:MAG TPA: alkyl hydroperoxide reductase subunit F, partial [Pusillimonas sp.]|nr:alkyl hydroperoxide reductase subunit F [Pusillimonas sp.]
MLEASVKSQLQSYMERISEPVELVAHLGDGAKSAELRELLEEIETMSDKVTLVESGDSQRKPSFEIRRAGTDIGVTFAGIPMGHEFTSLVLALLQVGGHPIKLDESVIEQIRNLDGDYEFETYFSLSCQNCPDVVQALNAMSIINPRIKHVAIDGALYQDEVDARQIMSVPTMFLNGEKFGQGRSSVEEILAQLDTGASSRKAEEL